MKMNKKLLLRLVRHYRIMHISDVVDRNPRHFKKDMTFRNNKYTRTHSMKFDYSIQDKYARAWNLAMRNGFTWTELANDPVMRRGYNI